jgi:hypothetical protein
VIPHQFKAAECAEAVGFSHGDFGLIVQTFDNAAGDRFLSAVAEIMMLVVDEACGTL